MIYLDRPTKRVKIVSLSCKTWCFWLNFTKTRNIAIYVCWCRCRCYCRCRCRCCWCFYWFWFSKTPSTPRENKARLLVLLLVYPMTGKSLQSSIGRVVTSPPRRSREPLEHTIPGDFADEKTNRLYCSCRWCCCCCR